MVTAARPFKQKQVKELSTPKDRNSSFEPLIVKKGQRKASILDDQILALYARGMSRRDIV